MIPSILCYMPPSVELLGPKTTQFLNQIDTSDHHNHHQLLTPSLEEDIQWVQTKNLFSLNPSLSCCNIIIICLSSAIIPGLPQSPLP